MCYQILLHYNCHVSLGDKTEKRRDLFLRLKVPDSNPTLIFSLALLCHLFVCCFYCYCETTDTADENLDLFFCLC